MPNRTLWRAADRAAPLRGDCESTYRSNESQIGTIMPVSTQIAVRLPDALVAWIDQQVADGGGSRAAVTTRALRRYQRAVTAERDAEIYRRTGGYPDLAGMHEGRAHPDLD